jgi:acetoacetyl-CoA reductase
MIDRSFDLQDRHILVTGGSRGIGAATVTLLAEFGARVTHFSRSSPQHSIGHHVAADVCDSGVMPTAIAKAEASYGPVYGVVANAGVVADAMFKNMTRDQWTGVMDTNLNGMFHILHATLPDMCARKEGAVVLVSSIVGERGNIGQANYAASKGAVIGLTKALALECARSDVRVNAVSPGFIETDMLRGVVPQVRERILAEIPLQRFGLPMEIAWPIAFLLSPIAASFITGEIVRVNGAHHT